MASTATPSESANEGTSLNEMNTRCGHGIIDAYGAVNKIANPVFITSPLPGEYVFDDITIEWVINYPDGIGEIKVSLNNDNTNTMYSKTFVGGADDQDDQTDYEIGFPIKTHTFENVASGEYTVTVELKHDANNVIAEDSVTFIAWSEEEYVTEISVDMDKDEYYTSDYTTSGASPYVRPEFTIHLGNSIDFEQLSDDITYDITMEVKIEGEDWNTIMYFWDLQIGTITEEISFFVPEGVEDKSVS
ncbi:MAG: hypothetical protein R6U17_06450, partial [Thermoplasmata archaeon]